MGAPHTHFTVGKRLRIVLHDGSVIIDKFKSREARTMVTEKHRLAHRDIKSATIYREPPAR